MFLTKACYKIMITQLVTAAVAADAAVAAALPERGGCGAVAPARTAGDGGAITLSRGACLATAASARVRTMASPPRGASAASRLVAAALAAGGMSAPSRSAALT